MNGHVGKILRINLSDRNISTIDTQQYVDWVGGHGMGSAIFWDISIMPQNIQFILKLNPVYYLIQGYRDCFIYFVPFWHHGAYTLYFWAFALMTLLTGGWVFRKLKPQFADVL